VNINWLAIWIILAVGAAELAVVLVLARRDLRRRNHLPRARRRRYDWDNYRPPMGPFI
jgi:hypothetical protein